MKKINFILLILLIINTTLSGCGGGNNLQNSDNYKVSGKVTRQDNGMVIEGVTLIFSNGQNTVSGIDGAWSKEGLTGTVTVIPTKDGWAFEPSSRELNEEMGNVNFLGKNASNTTYAVSGKITDGSGDGISNVVLTFGSGFGTVTTGSDGTWSKSGLWGKMSVTPAKNGWTFTPVSQELNGQAVNINFSGISGVPLPTSTSSGTPTHTPTTTPTHTLGHPWASFTVTPGSGNILTTFEFDASGCSDLEDQVSALQVRWDWQNDGTWDTGYSNTKTVSHQYMTPGNYTVKLEVKDTGGLTDYITKNVTVVNTAPTASFNITPSDGDISTIFQFDASGCADPEDPVPALQVHWDWQNDGTWDTSYSATKTASHQYSTPGNYTVKLEVKDTGGLTAVYTLPLTVQASSGTVIVN